MSVPGNLISTLFSKTAAAIQADPYFPYVKLLLSGDVRQNNPLGGYVIEDSSGNNYTPTLYQRPLQTSIVPNSSFEGSLSTLQSHGNIAMSVNWGANAGITNIPAGLTTSSIQLGGGDFTFESWIYVYGSNGGNGNAIFSQGAAEASGGSCLFYVSIPAMSLHFYSGTNLISTSASTIALKTWYHVALVRQGNVFTMYLNGNNVGSATQARTFTGTPFQVNKGYGGTLAGFPGYYSNTRVVASAVYTGNFTPPSTPVGVIPNTRWLLNYKNVKIVDSSNSFPVVVVNPETGSYASTENISTSVVKYGTGSIYFNGGTCVRAPNSAANFWNWHTPGSLAGAFTAEMWINPSITTGQVSPLFSKSDGNSNEYDFSINTSGQLTWRYWISGNTYVTVIDTSGTTIPVGQWTFIAFTYDGTTMRMFINGNLTKSATIASVGNQIPAASSGATLGLPFSIGYCNLGLGGAGHHFYTGYMDDVRITPGVCRYNASFTPPTEPLPVQ